MLPLRSTDWPKQVATEMWSWYNESGYKIDLEGVGRMVEQEQLQRLTQIYTVVTQCYNQPLADMAVNLPQCQLLGYVGSEQLSVAQVAHKLGFSATRTSNLVVDLCKRGYLKQHVASNDRRRRYLALTVQGQQQLDVIQQQLPDILHKTLQELYGAAN